MKEQTLELMIGERIREETSQMRKEELANANKANKINRKKDKLRSEIIDFLEVFNSDRYEQIKPFLEKTPFDFLTVSGGHISIEDHSCYWGYEIALGDKLRILLPHCAYNSHPGLYGAELVQEQDLNSGRIVTKKDYGSRHIIDVVDKALVKTDGDFVKALPAYQAYVHRNFEDALKSLISYIAHHDPKSEK